MPTASAALLRPQRDANRKKGNMLPLMFNLLMFISNPRCRAAFCGGELAYGRARHRRICGALRSTQGQQFIAYYSHFIFLTRDEAAFSADLENAFSWLGGENDDDESDAQDANDMQIAPPHVASNVRLENRAQNSFSLAAVRVRNLFPRCM